MKENKKGQEGGREELDVDAELAAVLPVALHDDYCPAVGVFFSSRRRHTRCGRDWSSDVCSSDLPPAVAARLAERVPFIELSSRELEVLRLIVKGMSKKEIGAALSITEVTTKLHVGHILSKLKVNDRTQAATTALQRGIIHLS